MKITKIRREQLQLAAFRSVYRFLYDLPLWERFLTAIIQTSDERFEQALAERPEMVERWLTEFAGYKRSGKRGDTKIKEPLSQAFIRTSECSLGDIKDDYLGSTLHRNRITR